jgi:hypothetical protein
MRGRPRTAPGLRSGQHGVKPRDGTAVREAEQMRETSSQGERTGVGNLLARFDRLPP